MIISDKIPSIAIATNAFGRACVVGVLRKHLCELAKFYGCKDVLPDQIDGIVEQIINFYHYFKLTEIILAFEMMKAGQFRSGENDRSKFYGCFSGEIVMDCLFAFKRHRNDVLNEEEQRKQDEQRRESERKSATPEERKKIILESNNPFLIALAKERHWLD